MEKEDFIKILNEKLKFHKEKLVDEFKVTIRAEINEFANHVLQRVEEMEMKINNVCRTIEKYDKKLESMNNDNENLKSKLLDAEKKINDLEELTEQQTNRNMRKTLIFTNVKEEDGEDNDTSEILSRTIAKVSKNNISKEEAKRFIERAHRGKPKHNSKSSPRPIYAAIVDWRHSEKIKEYFLGKKNGSGIYCDQMYGPRTSWKRSQALKARKELKSINAIDKGYVAYPAKLMVKKTGEQKYALYKDFSNVPVTFGK